MKLIALAIPFFLLALLIELIVDRIRGTGYYRLNDALNSLSMGALSTTLGLFTKILPMAVYAYFAEHLALLELDPALFDPTTPGGLAAFALVLVGWDFCYYWKHRVGHEISFFWAAHVAHHQSEDYNLSTALRQTSTDFILSWIFYLPLILLGVPVAVFLTAGAIDLIYQFWVHTQHIRRLGWMENVFVTPANHRVHHAQNDRYLDKNYGGIFIIFDRIFGTYQDELPEEPCVFGAKKPLQSWNPFWANLQVYASLFRDAWYTRRIRDKWRVLFGKTGWRPGDVAERFPWQPEPISEFRKYDPPVAPGTKAYAFAQFLLCMIAVPVIVRQGPTLDWGVVLIACLPVWWTLASIGFLHEGHARAFRLEWLRLLAFGGAGAALFVLAARSPAWSQLMESARFAPLLIAAYVLGSAGWLYRLQSRVRPAAMVAAPAVTR